MSQVEKESFEVPSAVEKSESLSTLMGNLASVYGYSTNSWQMDGEE